MFPLQKIVSILIAAAVELSLAACGDAPSVQTPPEPSGTPGQVQEAPEEAPQETGEAPSVTEGSETDRGFLLDNVLHAQEGDIHYHIYVPDSYDGSESYALYLTLPGYEGLYFQGVGENLRREDFAFEALRYNDKMIVAAPQLSDWGGDLGGVDHRADRVSAGALQHRPGPGLRQWLLRRRRDHVPGDGDAARSVHRLSPLRLPMGRGV